MAMWPRSMPIRWAIPATNNLAQIAHFEPFGRPKYGQRLAVVVTASRKLTMPRPYWLPVIALVALSAVPAWGDPFNPYAGAPEPPPPPLAADGTIQWGTFYKSAAMQQAYERLWLLGACRGTNKAITVPVENNKVPIDQLPEAEFHGTVKAVTGSRAGGLIAYTEDDGSDPATPVYVAQLHPAGVSALTVAGPASPTMLAPGMVLALRTTVNSKGRGSEPLPEVTVVTPPAGFVPDAVEPERRSRVVGRIVSLHGKTLVLHVDAGKLRRLTLELSPDVKVLIDAARMDVIAPGDDVRIVGRLWGGEGAMGAGTVFASEVAVTKHRPRAP